MKFSAMDVTKLEKQLVIIHDETCKRGFFERLYDNIMFPKNPSYTFQLFIPEVLFHRSKTLCEEVTTETRHSFTQSKLVKVLYKDFLAYFVRTNDLNDVYKRLQARGIANTAKTQPFQSEEATPGVMFEEIRGYKKLQTKLTHKEALKGEYLLHDLQEVYPDHPYKLENILEVLFSDFVEDYRKGLVKNPVKKVLQYLA